MQSSLAPLGILHDAGECSAAQCAAQRAVQRAAKQCSVQRSAVQCSRALASLTAHGSLPASQPAPHPRLPRLPHMLAHPCLPLPSLCCAPPAAAVVADQNAKLSIFATRPAIYTPVCAGEGRWECAFQPAAWAVLPCTFWPSLRPHPAPCLLSHVPPAALLACPHLVPLALTPAVPPSVPPPVPPPVPACRCSTSCAR